jgi:PAS domain S-box-containing protein
METSLKSPDDSGHAPCGIQVCPMNTSTLSKPKKQILYVDDEEALLEIGKLYIERSGQYQVTTCNNPFDALDLLAYHSYAAIVSDVEMPGMNGIELLKKVRASDNPVPFIIFTGKGREEVVIAALNEGADFYIQKGGENKSLFAELVHKITMSVERREVMQALLESEKKLSNILAALPYATFAIDTDHRVIAWNKMMEQITGISEAEMIGKGDFSYSVPLTGKAEPGVIDMILQDYPGVEDFYTEFRQEENIITAERYLNLPYGYRYVRIRAAPLYSSQNRIIGAIATIRDISDNFMDEAEDRKSFEMYKQIANISPDWEYWESPAGDIMYCSPSSLSVTGYLPEEFIRTPSLIHHIIHPDDRERVYQAQNPLHKDRSGYTHLEFRIITRIGEVRWIEQLCTPVYRMNRIFIGNIVSNRDITDRIELKERLEQTMANVKREQENARRLQSQIATKNQFALTSILELRDYEYLIRLCMDLCDAGIALAKGDVLIHYNKRFLEIFGIDPDDAEQIRLHTCMPLAIQTDEPAMHSQNGLSDYEGDERKIPDDIPSFTGTYKKTDGTIFSATVTLNRIMSRRFNLLAIRIQPV